MKETRDTKELEVFKASCIGFDSLNYRINTSQTNVGSSMRVSKNKL
nr:hypothetical protein [Leptospira mayottensis]